jgi:hypothetical protein
VHLGEIDLHLVGAVFSAPNSGLNKIQRLDGTLAVTDSFWPVPAFAIVVS